jgi:hypothetical protein
MNKYSEFQSTDSEIRYFSFLFLLVAGRYNALLPNGHLRDCHICNGRYRKILVEKYSLAFRLTELGGLKNSSCGELMAKSWHLAKSIGHVLVTFQKKISKIVVCKRALFKNFDLRSVSDSRCSIFFFFVENL